MEQRGYFDQQENAVSNQGTLVEGQLNNKQAEVFLRIGQIDEVDRFMEQYLSGTGKAAEESVIFRQYVLMDVYRIVVAFIKEIGGDPRSVMANPFQNPKQLGELLSSEQRMKEYLSSVMKDVLRYRGEQTDIEGKEKKR